MMEPDRGLVFHYFSFDGRGCDCEIAAIMPEKKTADHIQYP
jgi:hypothetical protein